MGPGKAEVWVEVLPFDVLLRIFALVPNHPCLAPISCVCRRWQSTARHPSLWQALSLEGVRFTMPLLRFLQALSGPGLPLRALSLHRSRICLGDLLAVLQHCGPSLVALSLGHEGGREAPCDLSAGLLAECFHLCPALQRLTLTQPAHLSPATRAVWAHLIPPPMLTMVLLSNMGFCADTLVCLSRLRHLQMLSVHESSGCGRALALPSVTLRRSLWTSFIEGCPGLTSLTLSGVGAGSALVGAAIQRCPRLRHIALHNGTPPQLLHSLQQPIPLVYFLSSETLLPSTALAALVQHARQLKVLVVEMLADLTEVPRALCQLPSSLKTLVLDQRHVPAGDSRRLPWDWVALLLAQAPALTCWEMLGLCWAAPSALRPRYREGPGGSWSRWEVSPIGRPDPVSTPPNLMAKDEEDVRRILDSMTGSWGVKNMRLLSPKAEQGR